MSHTPELGTSATDICHCDSWFCVPHGAPAEVVKVAPAFPPRWFVLFHEKAAAARKVLENRYWQREAILCRGKLQGLFEPSARQSVQMCTCRVYRDPTDPPACSCSQTKHYYEVSYYAPLTSAPILRLPPIDSSFWEGAAEEGCVVLADGSISRLRGRNDILLPSDLPQETQTTAQPASDLPLSSWQKLQQRLRQARSSSHPAEPTASAAHLLLFVDQEQVMRGLITGNQPAHGPETLHNQACMCATLRYAGDSKACSACMITLQRAAMTVTTKQNTLAAQAQASTASALRQISLMTHENQAAASGPPGDSTKTQAVFIDADGEVWEST